jgi:hypothetical protein
MHYSFVLNPFLSIFYKLLDKMTSTLPNASQATPQSVLLQTASLQEGSNRPPSLEEILNTSCSACGDRLTRPVYYNVCRHIIDFQCAQLWVTLDETLNYRSISGCYFCNSFTTGLIEITGPGAGEFLPLNGDKTLFAMLQRIFPSRRQQKVVALERQLQAQNATLWPQQQPVTETRVQPVTETRMPGEWPREQ